MHLYPAIYNSKFDNSRYFKFSA